MDNDPSKQTGNNDQPGSQQPDWMPPKPPAAQPEPSQPDWMPPKPPAPGASGGPAQIQPGALRRVIKKLDPIIAKTKIDFEACRDVVTRVVTTQEIKIGELMKSASPAARQKIKLAITQYKKAAPCATRWDDMSGGDRFRLCGQCKLYLYDFKDLEENEAKEIVYQREEKEKASFFRRADGRFLTANCPVGVKRQRNLILACTVTLALLLCGTAIAFLGPRPEPAASPTVEPAARWDIDSMDASEPVHPAPASADSGQGADNQPAQGQPVDTGPPLSQPSDDTVFRQAPEPQQAPVQPVAPQQTPESGSTPNSSGYSYDQPADSGTQQ